MATTGTPSFFDEVRKSDEPIVTDIPKLDLESYIQNYSGRTRFERLYYIGTHSTVLSVDALKAAVVESKAGTDWGRYRAAVTRLQDVAPNDELAASDSDWVERTKKRNAAESDRLEAELKGYKNNLIKESIRMGNEDLGRHYLAMGELDKAYEAFGRMRQDISVQKHIADVGKHLISVCIDQRNWPLVHSNVLKVITAKGLSEEEAKAMKPYRTAPEGIASLHLGKYLDAANAFINTEPGLDQQFSSICSPNDIAVYGGLTALATMDRSQLQRKVLESSCFRTYLELEPHIRRAISFFINGRYAACLSILEGYRADYQLDVHLSAHVAELYQLIRSKSIVQYFIPFSCVTLDSLDEAFGTPGTPIDGELIKMIKSGVLVARIDTQNKLLLAVPSLPRQNLQSSTLASATAYEKEMRRRLQRMNILGAGLEVKSTGKQGTTIPHPANDSWGGFGQGRSLRSGVGGGMDVSEDDSGYD